MTIAGLLKRLHKLDVVLSVTGGVVTINGPDRVLTPNLISEIRRHKQALTHLLLPSPAGERGSAPNVNSGPWCPICKGVAADWFTQADGISRDCLRHFHLYGAHHVN